MKQMKKKKTFNDFNELSEYILNSCKEINGISRFDFLLSILISEFEEQIDKDSFLPFFSHELINEYNKALNIIIIKLNTEEPNEDLHLSNDIFILVTKEYFKKHYNIWLSKEESICN